MRKIGLVIAALVLALAACLPGMGLAESREWTNGETGYRAVIADDAGLLDSAEYDGVMEELKNITEYCNAGFYTCEGDSTYVTTKAMNWGESTFRSQMYTMFIIDMGTRRLAVYSGEEMYGKISTGTANTITDNVYELASDRKYGECARTALYQVYQVIKGNSIPQTMKYLSNALLAVLAAILLAYMLISARMEQEVKVSVPVIVTATVGAGAAIVAKHLTRTVKHQSSSGGHGGHGGGGFGGGGGHGGGGSHGF